MTTKTIKSSGGDYTTLALAIAGETNTTGDLVFDVYDVDMGGGTIGATMQFTTLLIQANASARHAGLKVTDPAGFARVVSGNTTITINRDGVTIDGLYLVGGNAGTPKRLNFATGTACKATNLFMESNVGINFTPSTTGTATRALEVSNCVLWDTAFIFHSATANSGTLTSTLTVDNISAYSTADNTQKVKTMATAGAGATSNATSLVRNSAIFASGAGGGFLRQAGGGGGTENRVINLDYCAHLVGDTNLSSSTHGVTSTGATEFNAPASGDLTLKAGALSLLAGSDFGNAIDILGNPRPAQTPDIGAFQVSAIPSTSRRRRLWNMY